MQITSESARITRSTIEAAWRRRGSDKRLIIRDRECRGLALIVSSTTMRWEFCYRPRGTDGQTGRRWPNRTLTLGNPASASPDDARVAANRLKGVHQTGGDPAAERRARAVAAQRARSATLGRLLEAYEQALPCRPKMRGGSGEPSASYVRAEAAQVRLAIATIGGEQMPATELADADLRKLLDAASGSGGNARARYGALSRFLDWAQDSGHIQANPCALLARSRRPRAPPARLEYLTPDQLARLWHAADGLRLPVWRDITRFLIAVPCRRGEAARLDWGHLDLAAAEWRQPGQLTKNGDPHRLYLHPLSLEILCGRWAAAGRPAAGLVFPSPLSGSPIRTWADLKNALAEAAGLADWRWHDFRRSFATALAEAGVVEVVADAVLNHRQSATRGGVLGVYQRASRWPEQVRAMQLWGRLLAAAIEGRPAGADVVQLGRTAG